MFISCNVPICVSSLRRTGTQNLTVRMEDELAEAVSAETLDRLVANRAKFLAFVERRVGSRALAEDILQAAFVKGLERGGELRDDDTAVGWFYRILRNAVIDHYRHQAAGARALEEWAKEMEMQVEPDDLTRGAVCECLKHVVADLKPEYRQAIETVDLQERSLKDLAEGAGISANNAGVRVHRAREALRTQIQKVCGSCATHGCLDCHCKKGAC
jgi:RNA polymerase sigma factor (sigma-70 family)